MKLAVYKPGQGKIARITTGVLVGLLIFYGVTSLSIELRDVGVKFHGFTLSQIIPLAVFIALGAPLAWALFSYPKVADFLIETEVEMGRVIWPTRRSVLGSSMVVIVTVLVMSALLWGVDTLISAILHGAGLY